jgi:hypothetical protein
VSLLEVADLVDLLVLLDYGEPTEQIQQYYQQFPL